MNPTKNPFNTIVIIAALGYFVDIYDLILFSIVRVPSLQALGYSGDALISQGIILLNIQMIGMLIGGIIWGIIGDKKGRMSVLFLTIILYSLANIANGMITNIEQYYFLRFIAGLGLAGELGVGITLVAEVMTKESRGLGTTIVATIGIAGAVAGYLVSHLFDWRIAYYVGGGLGLLLLFLRMAAYESGMFSKLKESHVRRGDFMSLFRSKKNFVKYIKCILIGVPIWFIIGIFITLSPEFASQGALNIIGEVTAGKAIMYHYIGASIGALSCGLLSQYLRSRKKALLTSLILDAVMLCVVFLATGISNTAFYILLLVFGIPNGYWSVFITTSSEQFGTNIRATVTTTVPNFVRGTTVLLTTTFGVLRHTNLALIGSAILIGVIVFAAALYATYTMEETFDKDLDYLEDYHLHRHELEK